MQRLQRKGVGIAAGNAALVVGAGLAGYSLLGLVNGSASPSGRFQAQPTATVTASASPSTQPAAASSPPSSPGTGPPFRAQPVTVRSAAPSGAAAAPVKPHPSARPSPTKVPTPAPSPSRSCPSALVTLSLTVRCPLISIGGS